MSRLCIRTKSIFILLCLYVLGNGMLFAQVVQSDAADAENKRDYDVLDLFDIYEAKSRFDFYQGVNLFNSGYIAESLVAFQRAISNQDYPIYQYMYARASRAYGLQEQSEFVFRTLLDEGMLESFIRTEIDFLTLKKNMHPSLYSLSKVVRSSSVDLSSLGYRVPMATRVLPNGNIAMTFLKSGDIIVVSPTGRILFTFGTDVFGVETPFDVLYTMGDRFLVTSFTDDRIYSFDDKGSDMRPFLEYRRSETEPDPMIEDHFSGPQYLAEDEETGNIYVTTYGSSRVFKFTKNGEFLFDFGTRANNFSGLKEPTGIAFRKNRVVVADYYSRNNQIVSQLVFFDASGNYLKSEEISNEKIESIRMAEDGTLIVTTSSHILKYDIDKERVLEDFTQTEFSRLMSASFDKNNILWVIDQGRNRVETFSDIETHYAGMDTRITKIDSSNFPEVEVHFSSNLSLGLPVVGMDNDNITVYENNTTVHSVRITREYNREKQVENIIIIPSVNSILSKNRKGRIYESIQNFVNQGERAVLEQGKDIRYWVLSTEDVPRYMIENETLPRRVLNAVSEFKTADENEVHLAKTFRFALNTLIPLSGKKTIIFAGALPDVQTERQKVLWDQVEQILSYFHMGFVWINDSQDTVEPEYIERILHENNNLSEHTNYFDGNILDKVLDFTQYGNYVASYKSNILETELNKFVLIELYTNFYTGSGKDILGYMLPGWEGN